MRSPLHFESGIAALRRHIDAMDPTSVATTTKDFLAELNRVLWSVVPTAELKTALDATRLVFLDLAAALIADRSDAWIERQNVIAAIDRLARVLATTEPNELTKVLAAA